MQPAVLNGTPLRRNPEARSPSFEHRKQKLRTRDRELLFKA
jgi:hypothetical protein